MKKLMTIMTACLVTGLACADGSTVTSANIVGYKQITLKPGYNMFGLNWQQVGYTGGIEQVSINSLFDPTEETNNLTATASFLTADQLMVWNAATTNYALYFFRSGSNAWVNNASAHVITADTIPLGQGFWIYKQGTTPVTMTLSGQVKYDTLVHQTVVEPGYNMVASGFAGDAPLNDPRWHWITDGVKGTTSFLTADQLMVWNPVATNYALYFFRSGSNAWVNNASSHVITTDALPLGSGAWFYRQGATPTVLNESQPY